MEQMTREEIQRRMDELAREYVETYSPEIPPKLYLLPANLRDRKARKALRTKNRERKSQYGYKLQGA